MTLSAEDQLEIQGLVARYNHSVDNGDGGPFADTFVGSGVLEAGGLQVEGRTALEEFAAGLPARFRSPRHVTTNLVITGDGDTATLKAYVQMFAVAGDPPRPELITSGRYEDELSRVDGRWAFVRRVFTSDIG